MDDYSYAADQINEMLVSEYLKKKPEMNRGDVVAKTKNGKMVFDSIIHIFAELSKSRQIKSSFQRSFPIQSLDSLTVEGDDRYRKCQESAMSSRRIVSYLFASKFIKFTILDKNANLRYLTTCERLCSAAVVEDYKIRKEFTRMMDEGVPLYSSIHTLVTFYLQSIHEQMKSQSSLYKREVELGDKFLDYSYQLVRTRSTATNTKIQNNFAKTLEHARQFLSKIGWIKIFPQEGFTLQQFEESLKEVEGNLHQRRRGIEYLEVLLSFIEETIQSLDEIAGNITDANLSKSTNKELSDSPPANRMAIMTKLLMAKIRKNKNLLA